MNVLFITLDQFRGDAYGAAGHPLVRSPTLDRIAREGVRLSRHYSQAAPCSPGRAAIYTGTYQMNNRVVANGTPLTEGARQHRPRRTPCRVRPHALRLHRSGRRPGERRGHR